jgi:hypothetical protein
MLVLAAVLYLAAYKRFDFDERQRRIWLNFSIASLAALLLLFVSPSSTAVDRTALYLIPLQLAVLPHVPYVYTRQSFGTLLVILYSATVQFVWLNFGVFAMWFVPYRVYPF